MASTLYQNEHWLRKRLHEDRKSPQQIADECGTSLQQVYRYIRKYKLRGNR